MWLLGIIMGGVAGAIAHLYHVKADRTELKGIEDLRSDIRILMAALVGKALRNE